MTQSRDTGLRLLFFSKKKFVCAEKQSSDQADKIAYGSTE
jgi:hypothetical protein